MSDKNTNGSMRQWLILGFGFVVMVGMIVYSVSMNREKTESIERLESEVVSLRNDIKLRRQSDKEVENDVIYQTTGINPTTVASDKSLVAEFLEPAFTWVNGEEYDKAREQYIEKLGDKSQFITIYLAENKKLEGHNYIDLKELKSNFVNVELYALDEHETTMEYFAVVDYFMYKDKKDLSQQASLQKSKALLSLTVSGEGDSRNVASLDAYAGFNTKE